MTTTPKFQNLKNIPTHKIVQILDSAPYFVTDKGTDYGPVADELKTILWERQAREKKWEAAKVKANGDIDAALVEMEIPDMPADELDRTLLVCEIREAWRVTGVNGFSYFEVAIPPRIMNF